MDWIEDFTAAVSACVTSRAATGHQGSTKATNDGRQKAAEVLSRHPTLRGLLKTSDHWHLYFLGIGIPYNTEKLKFQLIDLVLKAVDRDGLEAAVDTCDKVLTDSAGHRLPGLDLTFFVGLSLNGRWDIAPGMYAIPFALLQQQFRGLPNHAYDPFLFEPDPNGKKNVTVLVRTFRWGPMVVSGASQSLQDPWPIEIVMDYNYPPQLILSLLSVSMNRTLTAVAGSQIAMPWLTKFFNGQGGGGAYISRGRMTSSLKAAEVNEVERSQAEQAFDDWMAMTSANRDSTAQAIQRISVSMSRSGTLAESDRVLDIAIALEILYRLDHGEIVHKLSTRAAWYLGGTAGKRERIEICDSIRKFYKMRSAIVHGRSAKKRVFDPEVRVKAFEIAKGTLTKHLSGKSVPDDSVWRTIEMGGISPGHTAA